MCLKRELPLWGSRGGVGLVSSVEDACFDDVEHAEGGHGGGGSKGSNY